MTIAIDAVTGRPRSLTVDDDGALLIVGSIEVDVPAPVGGATEAKQDAAIAILTDIEANTATASLGLTDDELRASPVPVSVSGVATAANQTTIIGHVDGIEAAVDGIEALLGTTNSSLATIDGRVDTLESLIGTTNSTLTTIDGRVDGVEASLSSIDTKLTQLGKSGGREYETVAASQSDQALGATGATGDYLEGLLCVVATALTSQVQIKDGSGSAITVLPNAVGPGVGSYYVPLGLTSTGGAWKVTTGAGVSVIATGDFT
jgi:hypothetical protein